ncbi:Rv3212 family protein [Amycolatopsis sp. H20-H5]|uniref:Rv3212 family protein n=1 Tax=Amycolatopsis sp. H20-H5 TaxID=3046309 RepID=UPI002DB88B3B|nr:hypothetical protein [Amycolatopsis sp. H20-H5]MEC3979256.1 hypothetical protein [Amycolatopsis sp. H20-H5]
MSEPWDGVPENDPARRTDLDGVPAAPAEETDRPGGSYGAEDVLAPSPSGDGAARHNRASRSSPWNRGRDRLIAATIAVVVLITASIIALTSESNATDTTVATTPVPLPAAPGAVPGSLTELWQARSAATPTPIGESDTVVTADDGEVAGRDPLTGKIRWHYSRDLQFCTVADGFSKVNAVYRNGDSCSEITQLDPATGRRTAQRNGDAELGTQLIGDGGHVTATGKKLLNTWRDDLVLSVEYGKVPAIVNPDKQPRTGCTYGTVAAAASKVGVIERCEGDPADRLTVFKTNGEHSDAPQSVFSSVLAGRQAKVVAMSGDFTAVALPEQKLLVIYGVDGTQRSAYPLGVPTGDIAQDPPGGVMTSTRTASGVYWFTGSKTLALSRDDLTPRWTLDGTMGPGITFAGQLVVPIKGGLAVLNEETGATIRTVGVDRRGYTGPVQLTALGPVLLEQRGDMLAALK